MRYLAVHFIVLCDIVQKSRITVGICGGKSHGCNIPTRSGHLVIERKLAEAEPERVSDLACVSTISTLLYFGQVLSVSSPELLCVRERQKGVKADGGCLL